MTAELKKVPTWFWVVSIIFLIWNLMGVTAFFADIMMSDEALQALPENERDLYGKYPPWTKIAYAVAVFGGFFGCIGLVLRKQWAKPVFILSLIGVLVQMVHSLFIAKAMDVYGPGAAIMPVMVVLFSVFLIWFAGHCIKKGWIG
ncbi:hypothetical protein GGR42_003081 [Saonia flava]|uniref:Sugar transporter n=1 Tax=Saonia flava TaxID=523696 RepID=A0A846R0A5_9FLAO|nr:hypothetical protein [Saonia flava]NJB72590.1 hypothetical protein [Saonia flava]